jgi:hypothetical protein
MAKIQQRGPLACPPPARSCLSCSKQKTVILTPGDRVHLGNRAYLAWQAGRKTLPANGIFAALRQARRTGPFASLTTLRPGSGFSRAAELTEKDVITKARKLKNTKKISHRREDYRKSYGLRLPAKRLALRFYRSASSSRPRGSGLIFPSEPHPHTLNV